MGAQTHRRQRERTRMRLSALQGGERHHALCDTRALVPRAPGLGDHRRWDLAPHHLVRRAAAWDPGGADGPRRAPAPRPAACAPGGPAGPCRPTLPGPTAVLRRAGGPLASCALLGDGGLGGRPPVGTRGERRRAASGPPPVAVRTTGAAPFTGQQRGALARPGRYHAASRNVWSPRGATAAGHPWLGRHQCAVVLPPPGDGGAVPPRRVGFTRPGSLNTPRDVRL